MNVIKNYLEGVFSKYPKTEQLITLKQHILNEMKEKYQQKIDERIDEKQVIGEVLSEYANVDKRIEDVLIASGVQKKQTTLDVEQTDVFLKNKKLSAFLVAIGVFFIILGVSLMILIGHLDQYDLISGEVSALGIVVLLIFVAAAVGMFVYAGMKSEKHEYLEEGFELTEQAHADVTEQKQRFDKTYTASVIIGVVLCILSPIALFIPMFLFEKPINYEVPIMLGIVAIAVFLFIYSGSTKEGFQFLLKIGEYKEVKKQKKGKLPAIFSSILWPSVTIAFLLMGFLGDLWHIAWIVFPIAGILSGMVNSLYNNMKE